MVSVGLELVGEVLQPSGVLIDIRAPGVFYGLAIVSSGPLGVPAGFVYVTESLETVNRLGKSPHQVARRSFSLVEFAYMDKVEDVIGHSVQVIFGYSGGVTGRRRLGFALG